MPQIYIHRAQDVYDLFAGKLSKLPVIIAKRSDLQSDTPVELLVSAVHVAVAREDWQADTYILISHPKKVKSRKPMADIVHTDTLRSATRAYLGQKAMAFEEFSRDQVIEYLVKTYLDILHRDRGVSLVEIASPMYTFIASDHQACLLKINASAQEVTQRLEGVTPKADGSFIFGMSAHVH